MFFADPVAAFANVAAALRPGGRLALVCARAMEQCPWYVEPLAAVLEERPTPETAPSVMFSLADPAAVRSILERAGFGPVRIETADVPLWFGADVGEALEFYVGAGPVRAALEQQPQLTVDGVRRRLEAVLARYASDSGVWIPGAHWLVTTTRAA
ncbi:hypothetical protein [Pseudonocardia sp. NPDC049635]|uniref:hypothetical protein n=1 Tax=Pseudonocardia sp. NPDC049635 TaxID=3155506 RepID=UPI0033DBDA78